jgi:outer membrane lipoprotein SlyB
MRTLLICTLIMAFGIVGCAPPETDTPNQLALENAKLRRQVIRLEGELEQLHIVMQRDTQRREIMASVDELIKDHQSP